MGTDQEFAFPELTGAETAEVLRLISELEDFKGHWRQVSSIRADRLAALRHTATIESTASSTRIEGNQMTDAEVAQVLEGLTTDHFVPRDLEEVQGYRDLHERIRADYATIELDTATLKDLHGLLFRHSERDNWHRGAYKTRPNDISAKFPDGRVEVLLPTSSPDETPAQAERLIEAYRTATEQKELHPLLITARFVVEFLAIHPFWDGNGRLSRALTTLMLLRAGFHYVPFASLERVVEQRKQEYYAALRESQLAMRQNPAAYSKWLLFILRALTEQKRSLERALEIAHDLRELSGTQEGVLKLVTEHGRVTTSQLMERLKLPYGTVRYHLGALIAAGFVTQRGAKRGSYYTRSDAAHTPQQVAELEQGTNVIIAAIYLRGGRIGRRDLHQLVKQHGFDPRTVGSLHGRRVPHLRREQKTGQSVLTARGEQIARQIVLARRLRGSPTEDPATGVE